MPIPQKLRARLSSPLALFLLAAALAAGVSLFAYLYLQQREATIEQELAERSRRAAYATVDVVVPMLDAAANTVLNGATFVSRPVEDDLIYPDTLLAKDFASLEGVRLARPVLRGRPVRASDLQQPEVDDVAAILPKGLRAMTIEIDNLNSIAQTLRPNHRVDIFLLSKAAKGNFDGDDKALEQAALFMQNMVVLATGRHFQDVITNPDINSKMSLPGEVEGAAKADNSFDSITLLVNPAEAAKLMVGQKMGAFRVVLRGSADREALTLRPTRAGDFMARPPKKRDAGIEFIVGGRGRDVVSQLARPPSQLPSAMQPPLAPLASDGAASALQMTASTPANQPVPALRSK